MRISLRHAPATLIVAGLTILASLFVILTGQDQAAALYAGFIPARLSMGSAGAMPGLLPVALTPLSATFVHGGLLHLVFNMVMLVFTGVATERALGAKGVVVLYLVGAFAAAAAQWIADPASPAPMIGASGAVSALVGAYSLLYGRQRTRDVGPVPGWLLHVLWLAVAWTILNLMVGVLSVRAGMPVAAAAHIGGFVAGLALCRPLLMWNWRSA